MYSPQAWSFAGVHVRRTFLLPNSALKMGEDINFVIYYEDMGINFQGKTSHFQYVEKATFSIDLLKRIETGDDSGFLCKVYCSLQEESN